MKQYIRILITFYIFLIPLGALNDDDEIIKMFLNKDLQNINNYFSTIKNDRQKTIDRLIYLLGKKEMIEDKLLFKSVVTMLGELRAKQAIPILVRNIDYPKRKLWGEKIIQRLEIGPNLDLFYMKKKYPCVNALIEIGVDNNTVLKRITEEIGINRQKIEEWGNLPAKEMMERDNELFDIETRTYCFLSVLIGLEGLEITKLIIENAIEKETDKVNLSRLKVASECIDTYIKDRKDRNRN